MVKGDWRSQIIAELIGSPRLDTRVLSIRSLVILKRRLSIMEGVQAALLFGSAMRGESGLKSDIDIAVVVKEDNEDIRRIISRSLVDIEVETRMKNSFSPIFLTGHEDTHFLWELANDGIVIHCSASFITGRGTSLQPRTLISYSYDRLDQRTERNLRRFLFEKKQGMMIDKVRGEEYISKGVLLLNPERSKKVLEYFEENNVVYSLRKLWY